MFAFCLSSNCVKSFSLRHTFGIGAALEGKTIFFNTFHRSLGFLVFFWSWFLAKFVFFFFFFFCYTELHCSLKRSWSTWNFVLKNLSFNLSFTLVASMISLSNHDFEFSFTLISFIGAISLTISCTAVVKSIYAASIQWKVK